MEYKYVVLTNTTIGVFMAVLDSNIVLISLPTIIRDLPATTTFDALWVIMGYTLITATLLLTFGRLSDLFGRVRLYNIGFAIFTLGSGLCSISPNGISLVLFRLGEGTSDRHQPDRGDGGFGRRTRGRRRPDRLPRMAVDILD